MGFLLMGLQYLHEVAMPVVNRPDLAEIRLFRMKFARDSSAMVQGLPKPRRRAAFLIRSQLWLSPVALATAQYKPRLAVDSEKSVCRLVRK
jgi:hypothetical protein